MLLKLSISASLLVYLENVSKAILDYCTANWKQLTIIVIGGATVYILCGELYVLAASKSIVWKYLPSWAPKAILLTGDFIYLFQRFILGSAIATTGVGVAYYAFSSQALYRKWRASDDTNRAILKENERNNFAREVLENNLDLQQYSCPICLVIPTDPVRVVEGDNVYYFSKFQLVGWMRACRRSNLPITNPLSRQLLPFQHEDEVVVDPDASIAIDSVVQTAKANAVLTTLPPVPLDTEVVAECVVRSVAWGMTLGALGAWWGHNITTHHPSRANTSVV